MVECGGLENRCVPLVHRGFESSRLRISREGASQLLGSREDSKLGALREFAKQGARRESRPERNSRQGIYS